MKIPNFIKERTRYCFTYLGEDYGDYATPEEALDAYIQHRTGEPAETIWSNFPPPKPGLYRKYSSGRPEYSHWDGQTWYCNAFSTTVAEDYFNAGVISNYPNTPWASIP